MGRESVVQQIKSPVRIGFAVLFAASLIAMACSGAPTSIDSSDVATMQARWSARGIVNYRFDFSQSGFFNACPRPVRVYVRAGVVDSAIVPATGQPVATNLLVCVPTIDGLFQSAIGAARSGALAGIRYDPEYGYPTEIDISGPPDASGSLTATGLQPE